DLQSFLTSTVTVEFRGERIPLSEARNLAYDANPQVRKEAYEAELASYEKIRDPAAFALNNIKNQVSMLSGRRGFRSPLDMTLEQSRMKRETLDAMMEAIREALPVFRKYLRHKAQKLGYADGLPWYELFAPLGSAEKTYTPEECCATLTEAFTPFSPELSGLIRSAFEGSWIDFYPRSGKQGGAFCADVPSVKESRILTNYDGTFSSVDTLAHELGHAFHNSLLFTERTLNRGAPMPVAETASTFNEVFLCAHMLRQAGTDAERIAYLEMDLREKCQTIVDIYSRYLFETAVFENAQSAFLMADDLCAMMINAQRQAYGDGLDEAALHPYMWINKSHYYSTGISFYNFPYAFGTLFAGGLYARYLQEGAGFVEQYKTMLRTTGVHTVEECGAVLGVDLTQKAFWQTSLAQIAEEIEQFCAL
ncbi:MAG: M3 family oligoendopeptidase, partial [Candidatus Spyradocola sp.]